MISEDGPQANSKRNERTPKGKRDNDQKKNRVYFAQQLQVHDFLLRQDLGMLQESSSFMMFARPNGERCLVTSSNCRTLARNTQGFIKSQFQSLLPNGSKESSKNLNGYGVYSKKYCAALDCVLVESTKTFYVIDIICWEDIIYQDFPLGNRVLFMQQKLGELFPNLTGDNDPQRD